MLFDHPAKLSLLILVTLTGCERIDPLSVLPNETGTAVLQDVAVGSDTRIICVTPSLGESCNKSSAQVIVENVRNFAAIRSEWVADDAVRVTIGSGVVRRFMGYSRDGKITVQRASLGNH